VTISGSETARRAERMLRWYPQSWRARYGEEFTELLTAELLERPRSWRRPANVAWSGLFARLTSAGLTGHTLEPSDQVRANLASLGCALAVFLAFGTAMWSQLTIGWQWAQPSTIGTSVAMMTMSAVLLLFVIIGILAIIPVAWNVLTRLAQRRAPELVRPSVLFCLGIVMLVVGARHFGNGWPGTGGHHWTHQGLIPGDVAAFLWALTLSISSYWAHPGALLGFPGAEVAWMVASPVAMMCAVVGATKIVRRLDMAPALLRYEALLGAVASLAMAAFLIGCCSWIVDGGPGPRNLFHAGVIDIAGLATMTAAVAVAFRTTLGGRRVGPKFHLS